MVDISSFQARCEHPEPSTQAAHGIVVEARAPPLSSQACHESLDCKLTKIVQHAILSFFQLNIFRDAHV